MLLGLVHSTVALGESLRVRAIQRFLGNEGIAWREIRLERPRPSVDMVREALTPTGLRHLFRKVFVDRSHPVLRELTFMIEIRQIEASLRSAVEKMRTETADVFQAEGVFEALACARAGRPYVLDMHGLLKEETELYGSPDLTAHYSRWEVEAVAGARQIIVVTERMRRRVHEQFGRRLDDVIVCPNGTVLTDLQARFAAPLGVIYAGSFAAYENVLAYVKTAEIKAGPRFRFWLMGDGAQRNEIFDYANENSVDLTYLGRRPYAAAREILASMQVGVLAQHGGMPYTGNPLKVVDYASCGLPMLAGPGPWAQPTLHYGCGVIVPTASPEDFAAVLEEFADPVRWQRMSDAGKAMVRERFEWRTTLGPMRTLYV